MHREADTDNAQPVVTGGAEGTTPSRVTADPFLAASGRLAGNGIDHDLAKAHA